MRFWVAAGHSVFGSFMAVLTAMEISRLVWSAYRLGMLKSLACSGVFVVEARVSFRNEVADVLGFVHCSDHPQSHGREPEAKSSSVDFREGHNRRPAARLGREGVEPAAVVGEIRGEQSIR